MYVVYKTTNRINGKTYVGQHKGRNMRNVSGSRYVGSGTILKQAIQKYGRENFEYEILEECDTFEEVNEREIYWIAKLQPDYNITPGGQPSEWTIADHPNLDEIKQKMSDTRRGKSRVDLVGEERAAEWSENASKSLKKFWREHPDKTMDCWGHAHDETARKNISEAMKKFHRENPDAGKKHGDKIRGRKHSKEEKQKRANSCKKWYTVTDPDGNITEHHTWKALKEFLKGKVWNEPLSKYGEYKGWRLKKEKRTDSTT